MNNQLVVSSSPHIRTDESTKSIMRDVIIALVPALLVAAWAFGVRAIVLIAVSVLSCVLFEAGWQKLRKKDVTVGDLSAVVTGILIAFNMPVAGTWWMCIIASFFAIIVVKQLFGGIGKNFVNPALAGRAFLVSWVSIMTTWTEPFEKLPVLGKLDVVSTATPLMDIKQGLVPTVNLMDMFIGKMPGCIGEVSAAALIIGGIYLLYRKVITITIPACYIGTVAVLALIFPRAGMGNFQAMLVEILSGGLMLGAIFMATDYATSPITKKGQIIFGIGCGLLTIFIRYFGGYPEGVSYSILLMNVIVFMLDRNTRPKKFGEVPKK